MAVNSEFGIVLNTTLSTKDVPQKIADLQAQLNKQTAARIKLPVDIKTDKIKFNISTKDLEEGLKKGKLKIQEFFKEVNTYKDQLGNTFKDVKFLDLNGNVKSEEIKQVSSAIKSLTTETHKWTNTKGEINEWTTSVDNAGQKVQTRTKQYINDSNELVTETSKWTRNSKGQWQQLGETIVNITDDFKRSSEILTTETHKFVNSKGEIQTWKTTVDDTGKTVSIRSKEIVDDMGNIITTTSRLEAEAGKPFKKIGNDITKVSEIVRETTSESSTRIGQITDTVNGITRTFNGTITTMKKVSSNGEELTTVISRYTNDMGQAIEKTETFNKANIKVATTMRKVTENSKGFLTQGQETVINADGSKIVTQYADGIATLTTNTREYTTVLGDLVKETTTYNVQTGELVNRNVELITDYQKQAEEAKKLAQYKTQLTTTTKEEERSITRNGQAYKAIIKTIEEETHDYGTLTTTITTYKNALGETVVETRKVDAAGKEVAQTTRTVTKELDKTSNSTKNLTKNTEKANYGVKNLGWTLKDAFSRLTNFYVASLPIRLMQTAITETIQTVKDFDAAITEMGKVSDYSGDKLRKYTSDLADLGAEVARTQTEITEAATGWLKAGYSEADAALLSKYSALLQNTADEEMSAADATSVLVSQLKAYHMEAEEAIKVTDIINKVSANQAVSSYDISQGLTVASAAMSTFGNSIEQTTALLTAGTTIFQGRSTQVARGLNMIATRVAKNEEELAKYGVSINDANGQLRSTYDILVDLAPAWNSMSKAEQVALGNTLAGTNQYKILAAVMSQMDVAVESYNQALDSSGETMKQNAVYMDSIEAKTTALKAEFEKLVISKGGLQDVAKWFVEIGTSIIQFINSTGGLTSLLITITSLLVGLNSIKIVEWIVGVGKNIKDIGATLSNSISAWSNYIASMKAAKGEVIAFEAETATLSATMQASLPIIGLVATVLGLAVSAIVAHNRALEEQQQQIRESINAFADEYTAIENTQEKLKDENISREELNSIIDSNLDEYDAERLKLLDVNEARQQTIDLIEEEKKAKAEELTDTGLSQYEESLNRIKNGYEEVISFRNDLNTQINSVDLAKQAGIDDATSYKEQITALKKYKELLIDNRKEQEKNSFTWKAYTEEIKRTEGVINELNNKYKEDIGIVKAFEKALNLLGLHYSETSNSIEEGARRSFIAEEEQRKGLEKLHQSTKKTIQELDELKKKYEITEDAIYDYIEAHEEENATYEDAVVALALEAEEQQKVVQSTEALNKAYEESLQATSELVSEMSELSSAFEEQEKNGSLSLTTQLKLIELGYALALTYDKETGACKLDEEAVKKLVEAKIEMQIANLNITKSNIIAQLQAEGQAAVVAAGDFLALAKAKNLANAASVAQNTFDPSKSYAGYGGNYGYLKNDTTQVDALNKEIETLDKLLGNIKTSGVSAFKSIGGAAKSAGGKVKDATEDAKKALEDLKSQYEKVISWISKQYDKKIDSIKSAKDAATASIEKEIKALEKEKDTIIDHLKEKKDALEDEKDAILDGIEVEIKALEDSRDARKKYWDAQIDALKKANDERKDALELQEKLDALERARNTKVKIYKEGQGFVFDVDQTKVAEAQKALDEYLSEKAYEDELARLEKLKDAEIDNYNTRIDALNKYKDTTKDNYEKLLDFLDKYIDNKEKKYDAEIDMLNERKEALEAEYDAEIEMYEDYKQQFEDMVNAYEEQQNRLLAEQLTGIDFENDNWMTRLDNLQHFVDEYNRLQSQLDTGTNTTTATTTNTETTGGGGGDDTSSKKSSSEPKYDEKGYRLNDNPSKTQNIGFSSQTTNAYVPTKVAEQIGGSSGTIKVSKHASGIGSIQEDEIAVVGENPNKEIVIGSKINNGELMSLDKGAGVVNADSSNTLASMLNQVGQFGSSGFGSGNGTLNNNINNDSLVVNGVTIEGSKISDPQTFVNGLLSLKSEALQRAYRHR